MMMLMGSLVHITVEICGGVVGGGCPGITMNGGASIRG